jgi:cellulose synthase/poly-beta-1,6-N-acetylglucosamine synthase-like glycosyltransferase
MLDQPSQYLTHVLPEIMARTPRLQDIGDQSRTGEILQQLQEERWKVETGVDAKESAFTVILPVYNEEKALPYTLSALMLSDIPQTVHAQFLFIVNATTDTSAAIIKQHLATISDIEEIPMSSNADAHVHTTA